MKPLGILLALLLVQAPAVHAARTKKAVCIVCQVKSRAAVAEPVRAVRTRGGRDYVFCTERCAREFEAKPASYVPAAPAPKRIPPRRRAS